MKTRIISGIVLALIVAGVLALGIYVSPLFITFFIALIAAAAVYELLYNAAGIKSKAAIMGACVYVFLMIFMLNGSPEVLTSKLTDIFRLSPAVALSVVYFIFAAVMTLIKHKFFSLSHIFALAAIPIPLSFAFSSLGSVLNHENGIYYLLLLLNFSSVCDMGAYFVGSAIGKHKLCPEISPHKTVEGAVGGIVSSLIVTLILVFAFSFEAKLIATLLLTVPFCILGMVGDLFASSIKRAAGIKDYGKLIPGHGGILDRFDSIIMISPLLYLFITAGVI